MTRLAAHRYAPAVAMLALLAGMTAFLLHRNLGLNPAIFADEWYYSKMSRLEPLAMAMVPSYFYLWVYKATSMCGSGFLDCARVLNAAFFAGAAPFIYLVARPVAGKPIALVVALLAMLAPANVYTAYFMPEAMYYFGFWVLAWVALAGAGWPWARQALAAGVVLGLMGLIKVHALFLLPALCLYTLLMRWSVHRSLRIALAAAAVNLAAMLAVRFGLGYTLGGDAALHLFGSFYAVTADSTTHRSLTGLLPWAIINARGHLMALALLAALPLAMLARALWGGVARVRAAEPYALLQLFALLMLGAAVGMTIAYTASIAGYGRYEVLRLHLRYYSFALPLLLIIAAALIANASTRLRARPALAWSIALAMTALLVVALVKLPAYSINEIDGPEVAALPLDDWFGRAVVALDILALLLWARNNRFAAPLFLFGAVPLMLYCGDDTTRRYLAQLIPGWEADKAGKYAHQHIPAADRGSITVAGTDTQQLMRAQFHIDDARTGLLELPAGAPISAYQIPVHNKWLLVIGMHALPEGYQPVVATPDFSLVALSSDSRPVGSLLLSAEPLANDLVAGIDGISHAESWGRWSDSKQVVVHFRQPLPKRLNVILKAQAFDINTTLPFTMRVGASAQQFRLSATPQEVGLRFETDGAQRSLTIDIPHPIAPAELGQPNDPRKLGIGISEMEIAENGGAAKR